VVKLDAELRGKNFMQFSNYLCPNVQGTYERSAYRNSTASIAANASQMRHWSRALLDMAKPGFGKRNSVVCDTIFYEV